MMWINFHGLELMMRLIAGVLLAVVILPYVSHGQTLRQADIEASDSKSVCVVNLLASARCELIAEPYQPMVLVRGQLLPVR